MDYESMRLGCIEWKGYKNKDGYGSKFYKGKVRRAHRLAYCNDKGIDIESINRKVVMHLCDNPSCVNPEHLKLSTQEENIKDRCEKGRTARNYGNKNQAKLTMENAEVILNIYRKGCKEFGCNALSRKLGVSPAAIHHIVTGKNWGLV